MPDKITNNKDRESFMASHVAMLETPVKMEGADDNTMVSRFITPLLVIYHAKDTFWGYEFSSALALYIFQETNLNNKIDGWKYFSDKPNDKLLSSKVRLTFCVPHGKSLKYHKLIPPSELREYEFMEPLLKKPTNLRTTHFLFFFLALFTYRFVSQTCWKNSTNHYQDRPWR